jgi:hypothetical protein
VDEDTRGPEGETQSQCATDQRKNECFSENLARDSPPAGSKGKTAIKLALARCGLGQKQVGKVCARYQQHDTNHNHQHG